VDGVLGVDRPRAAIERDLSDVRDAHLARCAGGVGCPSWGPEPDRWPLVSLVVCTHERPDSLADCLASLDAVAYPSLEIVIVDNAPRTSRTRELIDACEDSRVRDTYAAVPGLSAARNHGVAEARGEVVAFTDDDMKVDAGWVRGWSAGSGAAPLSGW
jgi:O-antigen biosynthesis protein